MNPDAAGAVPVGADPGRVTGDGHVDEALRQQALLAALHGAAEADVPGLAGRGGTGAGARALDQGLRAYRANARALAARALQAAYPVLQQLIGEESFAALAWALWQEQPPVRGDLAWFGEGLPGYLEAGMHRLGEPCLPDVARLEWAVHRAQSARDHEAPPEGLQRLAEDEPDTLAARLLPGTAVVASDFPVVAIWQAHQPGREAEGDQRFAEVRAAFGAQRGEAALVWRHGWRVQVAALTAAQAAFTQALLAGQTLGASLAAADADFSFETWLVRALREGWLAGFQPLAA